MLGPSSSPYCRLDVAILTVPVGLVNIFFGDTWQGALIRAGSLFFVSSLDNWLRPKLVSKEAYLNPALVLLSASGGISLFGFLGIVYGPIIMILFVTTIEVYLTYYRDGAPQAIVESSAQES
jgi:predicted PurR-regulated permease PerM